MRSPLLTCILVTAAMCAHTAPAQPYSYHVTRLNDNQPIISRQMFLDVGATAIEGSYSGGDLAEGDSINGPSVIRVPQWLKDSGRVVDPRANYYCYFANHRGEYVRMAWAETIDGPYTLYNIGSNNPTVTGNGVFDLNLGGSGNIELQNGISLGGELASPDVHVDHDNQRIVMYFHTFARHNGARIPDPLDEPHTQKTLAATSKDGLNFNIPAEGNYAGFGPQPVALGRFYYRVFEYGGRHYAFSNQGQFYQAPVTHGDMDKLWTPDSGFDYGTEYWTPRPDLGPIRDLHDADDTTSTKPRHFAVHVDGDTLHLFYTEVGGQPESIVATTIDLSDGDWLNWSADYPPQTVLEPELDWEGGDLPITRSSIGAGLDVRALRDPYVFEDTDGQLYLFYTGEGEEAIGVARLDIVPEPASGAVILGGGLAGLTRRRRTSAMPKSVQRSEGAE